MKRLATLCLISGLLIMVLALGMAVSAMPTGRPQTSITQNTSNTCLYCHTDVHPEWDLTASIRMIQPDHSTTEVYASVAAEPTALCSTCHDMDDAVALPLDEIEAKLNKTQVRLEIIQAELTLLFAQYPDWQTDAARADKTKTQIKAERISTLIAYVVADGSWGFHDPVYTEEILTEAEHLMDELLNQADPL
jgi:hypothetical protein